MGEKITPPAERNHMRSRRRSTPVKVMLVTLEALAVIVMITWTATLNSDGRWTLALVPTLLTPVLAIRLVHDFRAVSTTDTHDKEDA